MSITDELRDWVANHYSGWTSKQAKGFAIADRIDAEYQKAEDEWKAKDGQTWVRGYAECHAELMEGNEVIAADLEKAGWVRLPVDADGEVWHVGDLAVGEVNPNNPKAVERMLWYGPDSGWQLETDTIIYPCPDRPRHYHAPTVVEVLREMVVDWDCAPDGEDKDDVLKEYAEKLREVIEHHGAGGQHD